MTATSEYPLKHHENVRTISPSCYIRTGYSYSPPLIGNNEISFLDDFPLNEIKMHIDQLIIIFLRFWRPAWLSISSNASRTGTPSELPPAWGSEE